MARRRTIERNPKGHRNYFLVDANVLVYWALPEPHRQTRIQLDKITSYEPQRAAHCRRWWTEITKQLDGDKARVFTLDTCIAEAFKVLAKWYYQQGVFTNRSSYNSAKKRLRKLVSIPYKEMARAQRVVKVHDIQTNRDLIISVDRFFEIAGKSSKRQLISKVSIVDLLLLSAAKYLTDFFDIQREHLFILTCDKPLIELVRKVPELRAAINPCVKDYDPAKTFI